MPLWWFTGEGNGKVGDARLYCKNDPSGKNLEHLSSLNPLLVEFLQSIAFPQNTQFAFLVTSQQSV